MYENEVRKKLETEQKAYMPREPREQPSNQTEAMGCDSDARIGGHQREEFSLHELFRYHRPTPDQLPKYENLREAARHFAKVVLMNVSPGADRDAAIRKIREAVMTANAGVALNGFSL